MKHINNPLWKDLSCHLFSGLWNCSLCHSHAPCRIRPRNEFLSSKGTFTSACCQSCLPIIILRWVPSIGSQSGITIRGQAPWPHINQRRVHNLAIEHRVLQRLTPDHLPFHNLNSSHTKPWRKPVQVWKTTEKQEQWAVETTGLFWGKQILRWQRVQERMYYLLNTHTTREQEGKMMP